MPRHVLLGKQNLASPATLTASHEAGDLVANNLKLDDLTEVWRANAVSAVNLVIDLGAAAAVGMIALVNGSITNGATWRVRGATSVANLTAAPGYDSGTVSAWPAPASREILWNVDLCAAPAQVQTFRHWRIDIDDAGNGDGFLDFGALYMAEVIEPERNRQRGQAVGLIDPSVTRKSAGGQPVSRSEEKFRVTEFALPALTSAEADDLLEVDARHGTTVPRGILFDPDDGDRHYINFFFGRVVELEPFEDPQHQRWIRRYRVEAQI